jgi:CubicO group peptidase (beta-lactamase class C family)
MQMKAAGLGLALVLIAESPRTAGAETRGTTADWHLNAAAFRSELDSLRGQLGIPGLAYVVVRDGHVIAKGGLGRREQASPAPFTTDTPLRIASVTKALAALVVLQRIEAGRLSLDTPIQRHLPDFDGPEQVTLRHLLTHTSEGEVGREYVYGSSRYARVGDLLRALTGESFERLLRQGVFDPVGMRWYDSPQLGTHAALVSTVDEMAKLLQALDGGRVVGRRSQERLEAPSRSVDGEPLPVSLGWFAQDVQAQRVVWSFGQDDPEHSGALLLRVPARGWSVFVLANRNTLSDPFRLLIGDVRKSPVATAFLRCFVRSLPGRPLPGLGDGTAAEIVARVVAREVRGTYRYTDELLARALTLQWAGEAATAEALLFSTLDRYALRDTPDPVLHFMAAALGTPKSRAWGIAQGERLLRSHAGNRWIRFAQANLLAGDPARMSEAVGQYQAVLDLPNQSPDFLHRLFRAWCLTGIAQLRRDTRPDEAERCLRQVLELGVGGDTEAQARRLLSELRAPARR